MRATCDPQTVMDRPGLGVGLVFVLMAWLAAPALFAQTLADRVVEHVLDNGLTLLVYERHQVPIVACHVYVTIGSAYDQIGQTGIAHMTEHIAFKGTPTIGSTDYAAEQPLLEQVDALWERLAHEYDKGAAADFDALAQLEEEFFATEEQAAQYVISEQYSLILEEHGARELNAATTRDDTSYFVSLPANRLELWMMLEADRLANTVPREFYREREVVMEERQTFTDTSPLGTLFEQFLGAAFIAHPYGFPAIGWASDIQYLTPTQFMAFYERHYVPANMIVAIVGDVRAADVLAMAERYFGALPAREPAPPIRTVEPPQPGERRVIVAWDANPYLAIGYHRPAIDDGDDAVFDVMAFLLTGGRTSRLYRRLVTEAQVALEVDAAAAYPGSKYPTLFVLAAVPLAPHTLADLEAEIDGEIERLKTEPVQDWELQKTVNALEAALIDALSSNAGLAAQLAHAHGLTGDWRAIERQMETVKQITADDIMRVATTYFTTTNRTVAWLVSTGAVDE
jgi:predicted Zn-dependent peptidase